MAYAINFENTAHQNFPFHQSFIDYLLKTPNEKVFKKLYKSCKYFYHRRPFHIIDNLTFSSYAAASGHEAISFNQYELNIIGKESKYYNFDKFKKDPLIKIMIRPSKDFIPIKNIWITGRIFCTYSPQRLPLWISKITRCTIINLSVNYTLTNKEFEILTKEETIEEIKIKGVINSNGNHLAVENIIAAVPNAVKFKLGSSHVSPFTLQKLCSMNRKQKFKEFHSYQIDNLLDENEFFEFLKKHGTPGFPFHISFAPPITDETEKKFITNVTTKTFFWKSPAAAKPYLKGPSDDEFPKT